jgi:hypothetical protein
MISLLSVYNVSQCLHSKIAAKCDAGKSEKVESSIIPAELLSVGLAPIPPQESRAGGPLHHPAEYYCRPG